jgi:DMSO/TMAO reductase YedYZ molybdopterin-dependent catalytic subunit
VPVREVLARAVVSPDGTSVVCEGADHGPFEDAPDVRYARSLSVTDLERRGGEILLAYAMNGEPLTPDHGAPMRLIVPGWYAMASVKWLRSLRVIPGSFEGAFQTDQYVYRWPDGSHEQVTGMRVRSLITDPIPGSVVGQGRRTIRGKAWSGGGTVSGVEVAIDGEEAWQPASLKTPAGPYAWQEWTFDWVAPSVGRHLICARARDSSGAAQPDVAPPNALGYGNNAIQPVVVDVR